MLNSPSLNNNNNSLLSPISPTGQLQLNSISNNLLDLSSNNSTPPTTRFATAQSSPNLLLNNKLSRNNSLLLSSYSNNNFLPSPKPMIRPTVLPSLSFHNQRPRQGSLPNFNIINNNNSLQSNQNILNSKILNYSKNIIKDNNTTENNSTSNPVSPLLPPLSLIPQLPSPAYIVSNNKEDQQQNTMNNNILPPIPNNIHTTNNNIHINNNSPSTLATLAAAAAAAHPQPFTNTSTSSIPQLPHLKSPTSLHNNNNITPSSPQHVNHQIPANLTGKKCPVCGKVCSRPSTLKTHYLIHTGDTPYKCQWMNCTKSFNVKSNMLRHLKIHERKLEKMKEQMTANGITNDEYLNKCYKANAEVLNILHSKRNEKKRNTKKIIKVSTTSTTTTTND